MAIDLVDFIDGIAPHVSGCPESLIINAVRDATIRLCGDVTVWREDIAAQDITADVDTYTITAPVGAEITTIVSLQYDTKEIFPKTEAELDRIDTGWRQSAYGQPGAFVYYDPDLIKFNRMPENTIVGGLIARAALKPSRVAANVADILFNDWKEGIEHGALERLFRIPKKAWSDANLALYHGKHFSFHINKAKNRVIAGNSQKSLRVTMRRFV